MCVHLTNPKIENRHHQTHRLKMEKIKFRYLKITEFFPSQKIIQFRNVFLKNICDQNIMHASLWLLLYASLPTTLIGALITSAISVYHPELFRTIGTAAGQQNIAWFPSLIFNPLFESLILSITIYVSVKLKFKQFSIIISSILISGIHSLQNLLWGITVFCFFLIQSYAFFHCFRYDLKRSYLIISISHSLHNAWILIIMVVLANPG